MDTNAKSDKPKLELIDILADTPEVGPWYEIKGQIITKYASAYTRILSKQPWAHSVYVDMFAGSPVNEVRGRDELVPGSALQALDVSPRFNSYVFMDINGVRVSALENIASVEKGVVVYHGDGNNVMLETIIPAILRNTKVRALVIIDPYGVNLDWKVVEALGKSGHVDIILNFPIMGMLRNALQNRKVEKNRKAIEQMTIWWGDQTWQSHFYRDSPYGQADMFGTPIPQSRSSDSDSIVEAYCSRLRDAASFGYVADPIAIKNSKNSNLYYLIFASPKAVGAKIMNEIMGKFR